MFKAIGHLAFRTFCMYFYSSTHPENWQPCTEIILLHLHSYMENKENFSPFLLIILHCVQRITIYKLYALSCFLQYTRQCSVVNNLFIYFFQFFLLKWGVFVCRVCVCVCAQCVFVQWVCRVYVCAQWVAEYVRMCAMCVCVCLCNHITTCLACGD